MEATLQATTLEKFLTIQQAILALPDAASIESFIHQNLADAPGVSRISVCLSGSGEPPNISELTKAGPIGSRPANEMVPVETARSQFGFIAFELKDRQAFAPYRNAIKSIADVAATAMERQNLLSEFSEHNSQDARSRQAAVADLSAKALKSKDIDTILGAAAEVIAQTIGVEYCGVLQQQPGGDALLLRSGFGWQEGYAGSAAVEKGETCYPPQSGEVVIVDDWRTENRFIQPSFLREHGVISSICVAIYCHGRFFGALGADSPHHHAFNDDDAHFLRAVADTIASATEMKEAAAQFEILYNAIADPILIYATDGHILNASKSTCEKLGYSQAQLVTMTVQEIIAPKYASSFAECMEAALNQGGAIFECAYICRDGAAFPGETRISPTEFNGQTALLALVRVTTERKIAELAREELARIVDTATDAVISKDLTGKITSWNRGAERLYGWRADEIIGQPVSVLVPAERQYEVDELTRIVETGKLVDHFDAQRRHKDGRLVDVSLSLSPLRDGTGKIVGVSIIARDIAEHKRHEEERARMHEQMTATVAELRQHERDGAIVDGLSETLQICKDRAEAYPLIALAARQLFPGSSGALAMFVSLAHDLTTVARWGDASLMSQDFVLDDCWALRRGLMHQLDNPAEGALCHHFETPPGGGYLCLPLATPGEALGLLHVSAASGQTFDEKMRRLVGRFGDVIKLSLSNLKMRETLRFQSIRDPLTGLFNRQYLGESLPREIIRARRNKRPLCVAILDIDHFKTFNDEHGHDAGDLVLREVGDLLGKAVRGSDMACRYGGEEFLFVLPECDLSEANSRIEQIRQEIKQKECLYHGRLLPAITMSAGLAQFSDKMTNEANLIAAADQALYAAKDGGRDCIVVYSHELRRMMGDSAA